MARIFLLTALLLLTVAGRAALAGQAYEAIDAGDIFVATITRVDDKGATHGRPPRVWLEVHEVLYGDAKTERSPALWQPRFHGIDWGGGEELERQWSLRPFKGPSVGKKFILGGKTIEPAAKGAPAYALFEFVYIPYTDQARLKVIADLKARDDAARRYAAELQAAEREREQRKATWRKQFDDATIDRLTAEADAIAIGTPASGLTFEVERMLKGQPRMSTGGKYFLTFASQHIDERIADLVYHGRRVLFLSEDGLVISVSDAHAKPIDPYLGILIADESAIRAVEASLAKTPPPKPRPLVVISSFDRELGTVLAKAVREDFDLAVSHQFSAHGQHAVSYVRNTIPHARCLITIASGSVRDVNALRIDDDDAPTIYKGHWLEKETDAGIEAMLEALQRNLAE